MIRPYYDYSERRRFALRRPLAPAVKAIMAGTAAVAVLELLLWNVGRQGEAGITFWESVLFLTPGSAAADGRWWQFFTYIAVQPVGGVFALLSTLIILYFFGSDLERRIGSGRFVGFYVGCGVAAGLAGLLWPTAPMAGAEGPVLGVAAATALIWPDRPIRIFVSIRTKWVILILIGVPLLMKAARQAAGGGVPHVPELAGPALAGLVWAATRFRSSGASRGSPVQSPSQPAAPRKPADDVSEAEIDRILKKVHDRGIGSLSRAERRVLDRASRQLRRRTRGRRDE